MSAVDHTSILRARPSNRYPFNRFPTCQLRSRAAGRNAAPFLLAHSGRAIRGARCASAVDGHRDHSP